jgi:hypothetical protein
LPGRPCGVEGVGLAGARLADHHFDAGAGGGEPAHHVRLLCSDGRAFSEDDVDDGGIDQPGADRPGTLGLGEKSRLDGQHLGGGHLLLAGTPLGAEVHDPGIGDDGVGTGFEARQTRPVGEALGQRAHDVAPLEAGRVVGEPLRPEHVLGQ